MSNNIIYANTKQLDDIAESLKDYPEELVRVMNSVLARATASVRSEVAKQIPKVYGITHKKVNDTLNSGGRKVKNIMGAAGEGSVSIEILGRPLTLNRFQHSPNEPPEQTKGKKRRIFHVKAMFLHEKGKLPIGPIHGKDNKLKSVFFMPTKSGSERYLFAYRTGEKKGNREKLKVIRSVSVPQMVTNEQVGPVIVEKVNKVIFNRLGHEIDRSFARLQAKSTGRRK